MTFWILILMKKDTDDKEITNILSNILASIDYKDNLTKDDIAIPIVKIIQRGSDQILQEVEGAKVGMLYNTATGELMGDEIVFIPCAFNARYLMRTPLDKGGGFGGTFSEKPDGFDISHEGRWMKNGSDMEVVYTHYHAVLIDGFERAIIAMNNTQMKISKKWNGIFRKDLSVGQPIFLNVFKVGVNDQTAKNFTFKGWKLPVKLHQASMEQLKEAGEFYKLITDISITKVMNNALKDAEDIDI